MPSAVTFPDGTIKVYAISTSGHLIEYTRKEGDQTNSVIDVTDEIGSTNQILLAP